LKFSVHLDAFYYAAIHYNATATGPAICEISGSHGGEYEDDSLLVRTASIILNMEAIRTSETSVYSIETTRRYIPEGSHLQSSNFTARPAVEY
jgi:hypothetical protein